MGPLLGPIFGLISIFTFLLIPLELFEVSESAYAVASSACCATGPHCSALRA